jgi:hypothetical protein
MEECVVAPERRLQIARKGGRGKPRMVWDIWEWH